MNLVLGLSSALFNTNCIFKRLPITRLEQQSITLPALPSCSQLFLLFSPNSVHTPYLPQDKNNNQSHFCSCFCPLLAHMVTAPALSNFLTLFQSNTFKHPICVTLLGWVLLPFFKKEIGCIHN
eukprot:Phypoly_transcript_24403.p1 GENE.Phypoly_transcript_24403~~Phypoly_transcript_24403.p1  ORF type:complete len:123 (+),score=7.27 Phypoly_transcript_24403:89-457(+)